MRPKKHEMTGSGDLCRARLDQIINMNHELVQLAGKIDWEFIDGENGSLRCLEISTYYRSRRTGADGRRCRHLYIQFKTPDGLHFGIRHTLPVHTYPVAAAISSANMTWNAAFWHAQTQAGTAFGSAQTA